MTLTASAPTRSPPKPWEQKKLLTSLHFVGEVVDVAGWLGGYDFQWAWSSGWVAGQFC
ncbi:NAD(P)/FAD-dependent oxidoreductase [Aeromonas veronii]|nr:NAD(P)/FAD-dependent oxidoreductase [Aeromonas veronii]